MTVTRLSPSWDGFPRWRVIGEVGLFEVIQRGAEWRVTRLHLESGMTQRISGEEIRRPIIEAVTIAESERSASVPTP